MVLLDYFYRFQLAIFVGTILVVASMYLYRKIKHHSKPLREALKQGVMSLFR